jgi:hypothetical protein
MRLKMMEVNNIGHLSYPADRPCSEGWGREKKADLIRRIVAELCHEFELDEWGFKKSRSKQAMIVRQRVSAICYELLRPEWSVLEIAKLVGLPHSTMWHANICYRKNEGAELEQ